MNILALDLGTDTGYAAGDTESLQFGSTHGIFVMGTWKLATDKEVRAWGKERLTRRRDPRPKRLCDKIISLKWLPDLIVFEDVQFASSTYQTQLWASLRTGVWTCFGDCVKFDCVPVATLKKFATGSGAAKKEDMARSFARHGIAGASLSDDNAIDAFFIWRWAKQNLSRMKV